MKWTIILLLMVASAANADIYTWKDGRGTTHYTNSIYEVPARYREKVKVLDLGIGPKGDQTPGQQAPPVSPVTVKPEEPRQPADMGAQHGRQPRRRLSEE